MRYTLAALSLAIIIPSVRADEPEVAPLPRVVESHVRVEQMIGGYQIILTKKATDKLISGLKEVGDGTPYTDLAKIAVKELNDPGAEQKVNLLSAVVKTQAPALKKALEEKGTDDGSIIKVYGVENKLIPEPPPIAKGIIQIFPKVNERMETGLKVLNTTPLYWKVEGRK